MPHISVVVPIYNERDNIKPLIDAVDEALSSNSYELVLVDDGSKDDTVKEIEKHKNERVRLVKFRRNYGQTAAMAAGIEYAQGEYIVTMDGDLQNDPSDILDMLNTLKSENLDAVMGVRQNRQDGKLLRKIPSKIANFLIRYFTGVTSKDLGCTLKVFRSQTAKDLNLYGELHRFIPILAKLNGAHYVDYPVKHHARQFGTSKYGISRTLRVASDLIFMVFMQRYMKRPIHFFGGLGLGLFSIGILINVYLLIIRIFSGDIWGRPLMIVGVITLISGIQFITFGVLAEMLMRTYYETQDKKIYEIDESYQS